MEFVLRVLEERGFIVVYSTVNLVYHRSFMDFDRDLTRGAHWSHYFCGPNLIAGADCPNCRKKLTLLVLLRTDDPYLHKLAPLAAQLPLLYCFRCALHEDLFYYRLSGASVDILRCAEGPECPDQPYQGAPRQFAGCPAYLFELSQEAQDSIERINREEIDSSDLPVHLKPLGYPAHQVGGKPLLSNTYHETITCIGCGNTMQFLASIADECLQPMGFTGDAGSQIMFHYCLACHIIAAFAQSD